jgi:predicted nucleic acid-binding protein
MAANVLVDAGFLVAILTDRDSNHRWAKAVAEQHPPPWTTCDAVLSEAFYLLGRYGATSLMEVLKRGAVICPFQLQGNTEEIVALMQKYATVPMSFADACLVRMTEVLSDPLVLTTDSDFRIYRRDGRRTIPCALPE